MSITRSLTSLALLHSSSLLSYPQSSSACLAVLQPGRMQATVRELLCKLGEVTDNPSLQQQMLVAALTYMRTAMRQANCRAMPMMVCILRIFALVLHVPYIYILVHVTA